MPPQKETVWKFRKVTNVLNAGYRTKDIYNGVGEVVGTKEMGDLVAKEI